MKSSPQREELVGGSVVMGDGTGSDGGRRAGPSRESDREKLARRLKELSNARRGSKMQLR